LAILSIPSPILKMPPKPLKNGRIGSEIRFLTGHKVSISRQIREFSIHQNFGEGIVII
jgi:hypothetical protein